MRLKRSLNIQQGYGVFLVLGFIASLAVSNLFVLKPSEISSIHHQFRASNSSQNCSNFGQTQKRYGAINDSLLEAEELFCQTLGWDSKLERSPLRGLQVQNPDVVRSAHPPNSCKLSVLLGGIPRSGSTLQNTLVVKILKLLNMPVISAYYNIHLHDLHPDEMEKTRQRLHQQEKIFRSSSNNTVLVLKSHEFDPKLLSICRRNVVLLSSRKMIDIVKSSIHASWGIISSQEYSDWIDNYECWRRYASMDFIYEDFASSQTGLKSYILMLYAILSEALDLPLDEKVLKAVFSLGEEFSGKDANPGIGGLKFSNKSVNVESEHVNQLLGSHSLTIQLHRLRTISEK